MSCCQKKILDFPFLFFPSPQAFFFFFLRYFLTTNLLGLLIILLNSHWILWCCLFRISSNRLWSTYSTRMGENDGKHHTLDGEDFWFRERPQPVSSVSPVRKHARVPPRHDLISMAPTRRARGGSTHYYASLLTHMRSTRRNRPTRERATAEKTRGEAPNQTKALRTSNSLFLFGAAALCPAREQREEHFVIC